MGAPSSLARERAQETGVTVCNLSAIKYVVAGFTPAFTTGLRISPSSHEWVESRCGAVWIVGVYLLDHPMSLRLRMRTISAGSISNRCRLVAALMSRQIREIFFFEGRVPM